MTRARSAYERVIRQARCDYDTHKTLRLEQAKFCNAKLYWKILKELANIESSSTIKLSTFERYFKALNNPSDPFFAPDEDIFYFNKRYL